MQPGPQLDASTSPSGLAQVGLAIALVALTLASVAGFARIFTDHHWVTPVVVTALGAHALSALLRRTRIPPVAAMAICLGGVALFGVATALGASAFAGFPHDTWRALVDHLDEARNELPLVVAPVTSGAGFDLLAAWAAGLVAVLGDWGTFRLRSAIQGAAPGLALFVMCCVLGGPQRRTVTLATWLAAALAFLLVHQLTVGHRSEAWFGGRPAHHLGRTAAGGVALGGAALLVALAVTPALAPRNGRAVLGWRDGPGAGGTRLVESPIVDLRTRIVEERNVPVFTVRTSVPNYWRLTSLDTFTGTLWESTDSYESVHEKLPGVAAAPPGTRKVVESFRIQNLDSIWLPVAFDPQSVVGGGSVTYDATSGSLLTNRPTSNNLAYRVTSLQRLDALNAGKLNAAGPPPDDSVTRQYLQLPSGIPSAVATLAHQITAGKHTEYAKALALQNYLLGPSFTYSTDPPADGFSTSALATFLLDTRTGYCQQFAGSYAVMARIVGIPVRLAVGFATGTSKGAVYHVTDADAHTWPEVDFPGYGWVPFEPTKGSFAIPGGDGYTGSKLGDAPGSNVAPPPPGRTTPAPSAHPGPSPLGSPATGTTSGGHRLHGGHGALHRALWIVAGATLATMVAWPPINAAARRRRWQRRRQRRGQSGNGRVVVVWEELGERLAWRGVARAPDETPAEYARRAGIELGRKLDGPGSPPGVNRRALLALADEVSRARFSGHDAPGAAPRAATAAAEVARTLRTGAPAGLRLRWWIDPRLAWSSDAPAGG